METQVVITINVESFDANTARREFTQMLHTIERSVASGSEVVSFEREGHDPKTGQPIKTEGSVSLTVL